MAGHKHCSMCGRHLREVVTWASARGHDQAWICQRCADQVRESDEVIEAGDETRILVMEGSE